MGKSKHISKKQRLAIKANETAFNHAMVLALKKSKTRFKKFESLIEDAYAEKLEDNNCDDRIAVLNSCFTRSRKNRTKVDRLAFKSLMVFLTKSNSKIIKQADLIKGVYNICCYKSLWIKPYEFWKPRSNNAYNQFNELINWMFCFYPTPKFLYNTWTTRLEMKYIPWFIHIAQGKSVKSLPKMPILFTKKMAHLFSQAPKSYSVAEALRWSQVLGLGGDERLAARVASSRLAYINFTAEIFWSKFIQILVNAGMFNHDKISEIIDYLENKLREDPAYHLKGRNFNSLLRQSNNWHSVINKVRYTKLTNWKPCGLSTYAFKEGKDNLQYEFVVIELLNSKSLADEGKVMRHCVGSYIMNCARKQSAIFSIRKLKFGFEIDRLATVEVNLSANRVVQAKYKYNKSISAKAKSILTTWAFRNDLEVSSFL